MTHCAYLFLAQEEKPGADVFLHVEEVPLKFLLNLSVT